MQRVRELFKSCPEILNLLLFLLGGFLMVLLVNNCFGIFAPFIISFVIIKVLRPLMVKIESRIKMPRFLNTLLCLLIFIIIAALLVWLILFNIISGIEYVVNVVTTYINNNDIPTQLEALIAELQDLVKFLNIEVDFNQITTSIFDLAKTLVAKLSAFSINIAVGIPGFLISFIIGCITSFYMLYDYDKLSEFIQKQLSPKTEEVLKVLNKEVFTSFIKMVFSYILISVICFVELGIGFWILKIHDAWFIAFIIAIFDVLPIVGSGGILVPWGIIMLILGDPIKGIGLIVLWGVIVVVRQIVEPKIVGSQIGLHALLTIMALYVGLELMGGLGLIFGPMYIIACKKINESGIINLYK